ncbi:MAG: replicative DNA helicase, partial [Candidatus Dormibacteraeota bacterium]|nr:replicative DNA helicase [Candidatus Dormibacteraeota bacterium]
LSLFREGEPIDNVTVAAELEKMGVLERIGGRAQLAMLQEAVPTAANVEHYAHIVKDRAYKRRLIGAGGKVTELGYDDSLEAEEAVNQAQSQVYAISDDRVGSGLERLYDLLKPAMDRIDAQMAAGGGVLGIPSGFHELDRMTNGFKESDMVVIAGRPSMGKALALDTPIPTPDGWKTMAELRVGDQVFDDQGHACTVTFATPVMLGHLCYEVAFSDGERIVADAEHQWFVQSRGGRAGVLTTDQILRTLRDRNGELNYSIPGGGPVRLPTDKLPPRGGVSRSPMVTAAASGVRQVAGVRQVPSVAVRCIQVDSPSHLYLAGRTCVPTHNTSFVTNLALHAAIEHQRTVAIFSLEMSQEQLVERMLCEQARIDAQRLHRGTLSDTEYERLAGALGPLGEAAIYIDDSPMLDDLTLRLKARQARSRQGIEMIIVDYLQLMHGRAQGADGRVQEVSNISRSIKSIARELRVPVIAISQLSRAPEQRPDKRPILSDLRESGSIEQDSDIVMFLYRDDYYNREKSEKPGIAEVIVAKHRNGPTGTVELMFRKELTRFENLERRRTEAAGPDY